MPTVEYFPPNLSPLEAAQYVGVSKSWLNKLRVIGGGPEYVKLGRRIIYPMVELELDDAPSYAFNGDDG